MQKIAHISACPNIKQPANWGDKALVYAMQKQYGAEFSNMDCRMIYHEHMINFINEHDLCLVGGGGLILPDTFENNISGWQWGISVDLLNKIKVPLVVRAIGWNLFKGQEPSELLRESLTALAQKAEFISLRHSEDVRLFNEFTGTNKAVLEYCPTTKQEFKPNNSKRVGINIAGDRIGSRYSDYNSLISKTRDFVSWLKDNGYTPVMVNHMDIDTPFEVDAWQEDLHLMTVEDGLEFYRSLEYMFATRGHAQMIPFSMGVKTATIASHPKVLRFLQDVDATETLVQDDFNILATLDKFDFRRGFNEQNA